MPCGQAGLSALEGLAVAALLESRCRFQLGDLLEIRFGNIFVVEHGYRVTFRPPHFDPDDLFAQATDSVVEKSMYGRKFQGPARAAYVIDRDGTVLAVVEKVDTAAHGEQLQAVLAALR